MTDRLVKFEDLKVGDKINYMGGWVKDEWDTDIGTFVKQEGSKYWFNWVKDPGLYFLDTTNNQYILRFAENYNCVSDCSDDELIQELRIRGFNGTLTKTVTQSITL